jgi:hypothetical protein
MGYLGLSVAVFENFQGSLLDFISIGYPSFALWPSRDVLLGLADSLSANRDAKWPKTCGIKCRSSLHAKSVLGANDCTEIAYTVVTYIPPSSKRRRAALFSPETSWDKGSAPSRGVTGVSTARI